MVNINIIIIIIIINIIREFINTKRIHHRNTHSPIPFHIKNPNILLSRI